MNQSLSTTIGNPYQLSVYRLITPGCTPGWRVLGTVRVNIPKSTAQHNGSYLYLLVFVLLSSIVLRQLCLLHQLSAIEM